MDTSSTNQPNDSLLTQVLIQAARDLSQAAHDLKSAASAGVAEAAAGGAVISASVGKSQGVLSQVAENATKVLQDNSKGIFARLNTYLVDGFESLSNKSSGWVSKFFKKISDVLFDLPIGVQGIGSIEEWGQKPSTGEKAERADNIIKSKDLTSSFSFLTGFVKKAAFAISALAVVGLQGTQEGYRFNTAWQILAYKVAEATKPFSTAFTNLILGLSRIAEQLNPIAKLLGGTLQFLVDLAIPEKKVVNETENPQIKIGGWQEFTTDMKRIWNSVTGQPNKPWLDEYGNKAVKKDSLHPMWKADFSGIAESWNKIQQGIMDNPSMDLAKSQLEKLNEIADNTASEEHKPKSTSSAKPPMAFSWN